MTGTNTGKIDGRKRFECDDPSVCREMHSLLDDPRLANRRVDEPRLGYRLTLSYQSDVEGPLLLEKVETFLEESASG